MCDIRRNVDASCVEIFIICIGGVLSGNVGTGMCGPDTVLFQPLRFTNGPFFS